MSDFTYNPPDLDEFAAEVFAHKVDDKDVYARSEGGTYDMLKAHLKAMDIPDVDRKEMLRAIAHAVPAKRGNLDERIELMMREGIPFEWDQNMEPLTIADLRRVYILFKNIMYG